MLWFTVVADVNGDGIPDVIVAGLNSAQGDSQNVESTLTVFTGTGGGSLRQTFSAPEQGGHESEVGSALDHLQLSPVFFGDYNAAVA